MIFSKMDANEAPRFTRPSDYTAWRSKFEKYLAQLDPELLICLTTKSVAKDGMILEQKAYDALTRCLPRDVKMLFPNKKTTCELWEAIAMRFGGQDTLKTSCSDEGIKEKLLEKEEEFKALQIKLLTMENENKELQSKVIKLEKQIAEYENQQQVMTKLKEDHDLSLKNIQDLQEKLDKVSKSSKTQVKDVKKKICTDKSSEPLLRMVRVKKFSQFTNYSLQKNKQYSEKSKSTKQCKHHTVDYGNSGYSQSAKRSVSFQKPKRAFKPTQPPESRQTTSCVYTRAQMFALAPPRCHHMVQRRRKDFIPFFPHDYGRAWVPRTEFRHETTRFNYRWNSISLDYIDASYKRLSKLSKTIGSVLKWVPKVVI